MTEKHIDGKKVEYVIREIIDNSEKEKTVSLGSLRAGDVFEIPTSDKLCMHCGERLNNGNTIQILYILFDKKSPYVLHALRETQVIHYPKACILLYGFKDKIKEV